MVIICSSTSPVCPTLDIAMTTRIGSANSGGEDSNYFSDDDTNCGVASKYEEAKAEEAEVLVFPIDKESILYRGEGNSSLVVALKSEGKVIRLLKNCKEEKTGAIDAKNLLRETIHFYENVMRRVLNEAFLDLPLMVYLNSDQVEQINAVVEESRPRHRLDKSVPSGNTYALVLPDYCSLSRFLRNRYRLVGPVISTEIKPKQGFLPSLESLPGDLMVKGTVARFCMKQFHKLKKGSITRMSSYCPLDLFSGCKIRMKQALCKLMDNPQNNFRLFKDLELVYGEDRRGSLSSLLEDLVPGTASSQTMAIEVYCNLLTKALLKPQEKGYLSINDSLQLSNERKESCSMHGIAANECLNNECQETNHQLSRSCVLGSVLWAQKLDHIDSHGALKMIRYLQQRKDNVMSDLKTRMPVNFETFAGKLGSEAETIDYCYRKLWGFMVSLTAKDCSIIVTMQRASKMVSSDDEEEEELESDDSENELKEKDWHLFQDDISGEFYAISVAITDLDPKVPETVGDIERKVVEKENLIVATFMEAVASSASID